MAVAYVPEFGLLVLAALHAAAASGVEPAAGGRVDGVEEACDFLVRIPMAGEITSLNASVAGALLMYEVVRSRQNR